MGAIIEMPDKPPVRLFDLRKDVPQNQPDSTGFISFGNRVPQILVKAPEDFRTAVN
jgi:hypothetical protein